MAIIDKPDVIIFKWKYENWLHTIATARERLSNYENPYKESKPQ